MPTDLSFYVSKQVNFSIVTCVINIQYKHQIVCHHSAALVHLRNKFNFWNVHGIMNTSGLLQSRLHKNFARDLEVFMMP